MIDEKRLAMLRPYGLALRTELEAKGGELLCAWDIVAPLDPSSWPPLAATFDAVALDGRHKGEVVKLDTAEFRKAMGW